MSSFKPIYAKNNPDWRIRYHSNGRWELQEYTKLPEGTDTRRHQGWKNVNTNMTLADALSALSRHHKAQERA